MPTFTDRRELAAIFAGGAAGAVLRTGVVEAFGGGAPAWLWATFLVNVAGAFALDYFVTRLQERLLVADALLDLYGRARIETSVLLRGAEGFGLRHHLRTDRLLSLSEDLPIVSVAVTRGSGSRGCWGTWRPCGGGDWSRSSAPVC